MKFWFHFNLQHPIWSFSSLSWLSLKFGSMSSVTDARRTGNKSSHSKKVTGSNPWTWNFPVASLRVLPVSAVGSLQVLLPLSKDMKMNQIGNFPSWPGASAPVTRVEPWHQPKTAPSPPVPFKTRVMDRRHGRLSFVCNLFLTLLPTGPGESSFLNLTTLPSWPQGSVVLLISTPTQEGKLQAADCRVSLV